MAVPEMISLEDARALVLSRVEALETEEVGILDMIGRVAAEDLTSDIDISPFAHSAMDGFALRAAQLEGASADAPVELDVIAEVPAGAWFDGAIEEGQCVRIMTGAPLPETADAVVKYEIVDVVTGDGRKGSRVAFTKPTGVGDNIRSAGEEAKAGEVIVRTGEVVHSAGVGFLAGCGVTRCKTYRRPRVAIIATGSELVDPTEVPTKGKIRNSNSYALAACAIDAGAVPTVLPIAADDFDGLRAEVVAAAAKYDFVVTSGGAANGDFDFIKKVVDYEGELLMSTVNMRPGKAQTFGIVNGTPVFGLPGNPAAAYLGFEMIIRPALRKMQGYSHFERPHVKARLVGTAKKKDPRRIFNRATLSKDDEGYLVTPASNQSSGLFGPIQKANCFVILPEGEARTYEEGELMDCVMLDIPEEVLL
ncbi:MAG: molybdopterin molybdotransferase MoeA [Eggerthellaceae bacterium]|nr:molybdopterin molybdotransferase MoeA [Eggerthellaceae bacterium]MBQ9044247.1 molybdopterin molybdotransferase MoeA [Eggerthellaceae bacterium]